MDERREEVIVDGRREEVIVQGKKKAKRRTYRAGKNLSSF